MLFLLVVRSLDGNARGCFYSGTFIVAQFNHGARYPSQEKKFAKKKFPGCACQRNFNRIRTDKITSNDNNRVWYFYAHIQNKKWPTNRKKSEKKATQVKSSGWRPQIAERIHLFILSKLGLPFTIQHSSRLYYAIFIVSFLVLRCRQMHKNTLFVTMQN